MLRKLVSAIIRLILSLRYRVRVSGLEEIAARGKSKILFLPNHPALMDPIIMLAVLTKTFAPRPLADRDQANRPVIRFFAKLIRARKIPDLSRYTGPESREQIQGALADSIEGLKQGENMLMYPAGHILRSRCENLGSNSAVETILSNAPDVRVVLARTHGLWGSSFSWASGREPNVAANLKVGLKYLLLNGIFFTPRREVSIEFVEPDDLPRSASREELNRYLQDFYNSDAPANTYVPYTIWERGGVRTRPEPETKQARRDTGDVPQATRDIIKKHLMEITDRENIRDEDHLTRDLGLDSLAATELIAWLESEFGFPPGDVYGLETVGDLLLAACGMAASSTASRIKPPSGRWFVKTDVSGPAKPAEGNTVTEVFLAQAAKNPNRIIIADQLAGVKSFRDIITAVMVLKNEIEKLEGERIGLMLPASVTADILYLATLFASRTPVMVNWTTGQRNVIHSLNLVGVRRVLTARKLVDSLASKGTDLGELSDRFVFLEELAESISPLKKLRAAVKARTTWGELRKAKVPETAVILFTSGSESLPKAVGLTHKNLLANLCDVFNRITISENDRLLGFLPPFHSFGLTATVLVPLCVGVPTAYHANPTDGATLAQMVESYSITTIIGTPTFLNGIVRAANKGQVSTLKLTVTGAEKCSERLYQRLGEKVPQMVTLEGYGVTECSPIITLNDEKQPTQGSIGKVLPTLEHVLLDPETGRRTAPGAAGILLVRGPSVFGGYINYDGESPFVDFEGKRWYRTGDLVREDNDGVLTFSGRLKRFVKMGGEMISLPAVEGVIAAAYSSEDDEGPVVAVEATPDEEHPELVLFTTLKITRAEANEKIRSSGLSPLHNIRKVILLEEIPVLGTGKTDYRALKAKLEE